MKKIANIFKFKHGFTMLELLVTISVSIMLTSMLILYSRTGEMQITLISERSKILSLITRAKSLSVQTLAEATPPCGYGVYVDVAQNQYFLFKNTASIAAGDECSEIKKGNINPMYDPNPVGNPRDKIIETYKLSNGILFPVLAMVSKTILFIPPDPTTLLIPTNALSELTITIETDNATPTQASVTINRFGQITY